MKQQQQYQFNIHNQYSDDNTFNILGASFNGTNISGATPVGPGPHPLPPGGANPIINVPQSSTKQAQRDNQVSVFTIKSMQISVSDPAQLSEPFYIVTKDMAGAQTQTPLNLTRFRNPSNPQANLIELDASTGFQPMKVWSDVGFAGTIKAGANMDIYITFEYDSRPGFSNFTGKFNNVEDFISYLAKKSNFISGKKAA